MSKTLTGVASVAKVFAKPSNLKALEAHLDVLRARFPQAVFDRYMDRVPTIADPDPASDLAPVNVFPLAAIIGDVTLEDGVSIWYNCTLRGDINSVRIGRNTNIQDGSVIHVSDASGVEVGEDTVVGHKAMIHACTVGSRCLIGMSATVLDGASVGDGSIIAAGAVVPPTMQVPPRSLVAGVPGKVLKELGDDDEDFIQNLADKYGRLLHNYHHG